MQTQGTSHAVKVNIMCSPSIDLSYICPQKYATTYIHHNHYVLLRFLEVPHIYTHYTLCYFYTGNMHLCCSYPGSTKSFIHPYTFHIYFTSTQKIFNSYNGREYPKISIAIMSYSTYPIKLQLFQLILPIVISALEMMAGL